METIPNFIGNERSSMGVALPTHKKGDTFQGYMFRMVEVVDGVSVPISLKDTKICIDVRRTPTAPLTLRLTNYPTEVPSGSLKGTLSVIDENDGTWQIDRQVFDIPPVEYVYDVQFTFPGTPPIVETWFDGTWLFTQDVTHD